MSNSKSGLKSGHILEIMNDIEDEYIMDFELMRYLEFARVNPNEVYEWKPYWFDRDTVIIQTTSKDSYYVQDYYVYDIQGERTVQ